VIGVRTPEFGFEHDRANVRRAVPDKRIRMLRQPFEIAVRACR
jgi:hypothetical protein